MSLLESFLLGYKLFASVLVIVGGFAIAFVAITSINKNHSVTMCAGAFFIGIVLAALGVINAANLLVGMW